MKTLSPYWVVLLTCGVLTVPFAKISAQITVTTSATIRPRNTV